VHDSYIENCNEKHKVILALLILALRYKEPESFFDGWQLSVGIELVDDLGYLLLIWSAVGPLVYISRQSMILGFLVAGVLIGPSGPFSLIKDT
jgi:hypothetical protein